MDTKEFRTTAHQMVDWMADYMENTTRYDVKPKVKPGDIKNQLPTSAPQTGEDFQAISIASFKSGGVS